MKRFSLPVLAAVLLLVAVPAAADAKIRRIQSPSGNIFCAYLKARGTPAQVRCEATFINDVAGIVKVRGRARFKRVTDTIADPQAPVLRYGKKKRWGKFRCSSSRRGGLRCKSRKSGHGIFLSREHQGTF
ncbi:MAG TPA: DUF6636 domain-containing protein [Solirubrobacteraceae bacterium]|jgi:hypothetical protein